MSRQIILDSLTRHQSMHFPGRAILHLDLDAFFVEVELLRQPTLRGRPLIIGGQSKRAVVASCSYEARAYGVRSAMPMSQALALCPLATVLPADMAAYSRHSTLVRDVIAEHAPLFEQASIDEFYLDLTGLDRYIGCWAWSIELRNRLRRETGLPLSMALAVNKTVAKVGAGEAKPNGCRLIPVGTERDFLAPLPVGKLPNVGPETEKKLLAMGIRTVGALASMQRGLLEHTFGRSGRAIWEKANGRCDSPVTPDREAVSISTEDTFNEDTADRDFLRNKIRSQVRELGYELRSLGKIASCVTIKLRYANFETHTKQATVPFTAHDSALTQHALDLFERLHDSRRSVRLVGVRLGGLATGMTPANLFADGAKEARLLHTLDQLRNRFGKGSVVVGKPMP